MIAVTGAGGFVGSALVREAAARGLPVLALSRDGAPIQGATVHRALGDLTAGPPDPACFAGAEVVIHCAARVHRLGEREDAATRAAHLAANRDAPLAVARAAAAAGAGRIVFLSTLKVLGERTIPERPFRHDDPPGPVGAYAVAKAEGERLLGELAASGGPDVVVVRPPLVHGPGAGGNLERLIRAIARGTPLPLGAIRNRRALVGVANLTDLLLRVAVHPRAAGGTFLVRDDVSLSTPEIVSALGEGLGKAPRLVAVPTGLLRVAGLLTGRRGAVGRLVDSLDVDMTYTRNALDWHPVESGQEGLRRMAAAHRI